jgi:outer membrane protein OmpA-like peptidoglycan-associated protein
MPGSYLLLDKLGETMTSFGSTVLRIEGNTDSTGSAAGNLTLSERRAQSVKNYFRPRAFKRSGVVQPTRSPRTPPKPGANKTVARISR